MIVVQYAGVEYLLSRWNYTGRRVLSQRVWMSMDSKSTAITITKRINGYAYLVCSPDGELLDVGVCPSRGDCKRLSMRCLEDFIGHCKLKLRDCSPDFRRWLA